LYDSTLAGLASSSMPSGTGDGGFGGPTYIHECWDGHLDINNTEMSVAQL
jgi:hypothetical protein